MFLVSRTHVLLRVIYLSFFLFIWVSGENLPSCLKHKSFLSVHKSEVCVCEHLYSHTPCHIGSAGLVSCGTVLSLLWQDPFSICASVLYHTLYPDPQGYAEINSGVPPVLTSYPEKKHMHVVRITDSTRLPVEQQSKLSNLLPSFHKHTNTYRETHKYIQRNTHIHTEKHTYIQRNTHTYRETHIHTEKHTNTYRETHKYIQRNTQIHTEKHTTTYRETHIHTEKHTTTYRETHKYIQRNTQLHTEKHTYIQRNTQIHTEKHTNTYRETHKYIQRNTQIHTEKHTNTYRETHKYIQRNTHIHTEKHTHTYRETPVYRHKITSGSRFSAKTWIIT